MALFASRNHKGWAFSDILFGSNNEEPEVQVVQVLDAAGVVMGDNPKPYALAASDWNYAPPLAGYTNSTAGVTIKAAAGGSLRNYITMVHIVAQALATASTVVIRDGASGTVLLRVPVPLAGTPNGISIPLPSPLKGTANTLLEIAMETLSATGAVYVNVTGYTAL